MQIVKKTTAWQELSDHIVLIVIDAHAHIQHNTGMQQFVDYLHLLNKVPYMLVSEPLFFYVLFDCYFLTQPLA